MRITINDYLQQHLLGKSGCIEYVFLHRLDISLPTYNHFKYANNKTTKDRKYHRIVQRLLINVKLITN